MQVQRDRMIEAMKHRKMTARDFMKMGIAQYNARIFEIKAKGIQVESQNVIGSDGKVSRYKEYWIPKNRSNWFTNKVNKI